ncbi:MAG: type II toxin-antitoxin system RelE/ParE family toxin [Bacteroidetes bacterium]|nr:type II toxin-antitoxin system RelE/ParE family toxin [Bacteroidota bacterium]
MAYNIVYKKSVLRDIKKLDNQAARKLIEQLEKDLSEKPMSYPSLKGQFTGLRKYRYSSYRVIFAILESDVLVLRIGHRRDIYR